MVRRGIKDDAVWEILGGNALRVARSAWGQQP